MNQPEHALAERLGANGPIVIAGAGLAGSLLAIYLGRAGCEVTVYESRPDLRRVDIDSGRSINLALATRGIVPLVDVGVIERIDEITIPMRGRMIHVDGDPTPDLQRYGAKPHEVIHSVSRTDLNAILLDAAVETGRVTIEFESRIKSVDLDGRIIRFDNREEAPFGVIFGADGAGSRVRKAVAEAGSCVFQTDWLDHDYKELEIAPGENGEHRLDPNALHIWPRGELMLIALANPTGDFTVTLFAPKSTFAELTDADAVDAFFNDVFADFVPLVPDIAEQFAANPTGPLGTLRAQGWSHDDRAVIVGDAAHAIVPFHGQGMNAALESVRALVHHLSETPGSLTDAFTAYDRERKPDADAIAEMALGNYIEMRSGVVDPNYLAARSLALELEARHGEHLSPRYNMVMFSTMPYAEAKGRAETQKAIIQQVLGDPSLDVDELIRALPVLPELDPLADPDALSVS